MNIELSCTSQKMEFPTNIKPNYLIEKKLNYGLK